MAGIFRTIGRTGVLRAGRSGGGRSLVALNGNDTDTVLEALQGTAFHLGPPIYRFLSGTYAALVSRPVPDLHLTGMHIGTVREILRLHREQLRSPEYLKSRISNPATGTIDHLHAEITASWAVRLGECHEFRGYAVELLRTAGHLHDADRSFPRTMIRGEESVRHDAVAYSLHKERHAANSWRRASEILTRARENGFFMPAGFASDLRHLILRHELGGEMIAGRPVDAPSLAVPALNLNRVADLLCAADSLAYFDANILTNWEECGKDRELLRHKVRFMYDRMMPEAQDQLRASIVFSASHILGAPSEDPDVAAIRSLLMEMCV